ncbi:ABC transporter substrate-binding protein [Azoarcus communis]|uniref:ABC transporter substrate-binding protein n=1 Tax=Parazoarcus communis SWub3 = DSM 12120 TaxID=1121029 RepID=A0A323V9Y5_9RHOO|nr:TRAP transporter substrate-binding protein DctP [Parazoarcus communis]NMG50790.1 ABC transporter substrate-binding protein [Parazoarcus communis]NMG71178.1 ABC transporter substrate-binding protein [Parazoarcus communis SWub3 = DSM 12120]PZA17058.1 ABC transporter substrate-binding protein [Azoarcus communis] [Parazoarcus communis SWub3 = DSM 12120]
MHKTSTRLAAGVLFALVASTSHGAEITLKAVTAFGKDTFFAKRFNAFVEKVNAEGKGVMKIQVVGGPESMPPFEVGNALRAGVVDFANSTGVFHANLVPEALAMTLAEKPMAELRANGGHALLDKIHREKANMVWLARVSDGLEYHIYTSKKPTGSDFSGYKLRSVPVYRAFFQAIGAAPLQVPPGEVYTALERGVVDGYGWPSMGIFDLGWQEKTKYRVDPGFYNVEVSFFMNQNTWKKLDASQRAFLEKQIAWVEAQTAEDLKAAEDEKARQAKAGIETFELPASEVNLFRAKAYEAGWKGVEQASPQHAAQLKTLFSNGR